MSRPLRIEYPDAWYHVMNRSRYKAVLVEADSYLLEVMRYIHRNPLKAGMVESLEKYRWSSHHGYLSQSKKWSWLQKDVILAMLAQSRTKRRSAYVDFVSKGEPEEIEKFYSLKNLPSILGGKPFKEFIKERFSGLLGRPEIPESKVLAFDPEKVISAVCEYYHVSRIKLFESRRGKENIKRDVAI